MRRVYLIDWDRKECDVLESDIMDQEDAAPRERDDVRSGQQSAWAMRVLLMPLLRKFVLPTGFPASVSRDYTGFVKWNVLRQLTSSAYNVIGTSSMFGALGVGGASKPALSAAWNWVLKDGLGMSSKVALGASLAPIIDRNPKRWRVLGDGVQTLGTVLEIMTAWFPGQFLLLASLGTMFKKGGDVATGPSYRVFLNSFAVTNNIGDVSSRAESQVVLGNLTGLGVGIALSSLIQDDTLLALECYAMLACLHVFCTYKSVSNVWLRTLNWTRASVLLRHYVSFGEVLSVQAVNERENFLSLSDATRLEWCHGSVDDPMSVDLGADLLDLVESGSELCTLLEQHGTEKYILGYNRSQRRLGVLFRDDAEPGDELRALLHAQYLLQLTGSHAALNELACVLPVLQQSHAAMERSYPSLVLQLKQLNYTLDSLLIDPDRRSTFQWESHAPR
ncbi:RUS1 family protein C16orf58-like [Porphyridium purpureum]|uniref:RUS1 family protein C16orf58-like n=1 Tax=Porphyridium purpureum TaxID=35688 RepID=A0A5J4YPY5_PORPP|nr:RUS1 family protein C16orf58-like [Porphyridium purpureum]|eukprot:POR7278..scf296_7